MGPLFWLPTRGRGSEVAIASGPTPPVPGPSLWLRGDDAPNSSGMGLAVPLWKDVSGNGNDATQAVVASQPTGLSNQINGHAAVVFDGVNDFLDLFNIGSLTQASIFCVAINSTGSDAGLWNFDNDGSGVLSEFYPAGGSIYEAFGSSSRTGPITPGSTITLFSVYDVVSGSSIFKITQNGIVLSSNNTNTVRFPSFVSTLGVNSVNSFLNGKFAEILIYPIALSDSDRQTVQAYLGTKYAIQLGLPQITLLDFSGITGVNFVTGSAGLYVTFQAHNGPTNIIFWFNTGTETEPALGAFLYIPIGCAPTDTAQQIATDFFNSVAAYSGSFTATIVDGSAGAGSLTAVQITDKQTGTVTAATAGNSGVAVSVTQSGVGNS